MAKSASKSTRATKSPPRFPALTSAQRAWVAARRDELKTAIDAGIASGEKQGYVEFDVRRLLGLIEQRQAAKPAKQRKRG